jgi:formate/nitrite transporter
VGLAVFVALSGHAKLGNHAVGYMAVEIAIAKVNLPFDEAFFRGALCNVLVCLAVWLAMAGRSAADKVLAVLFPIAAFVAAGFEHCVANMYFIPLGLFLKGRYGPEGGAALDWLRFAESVLPVTLGNLFGGTIMVGVVYYVIYRCRAFRSSEGS